MNEFFLIKKHKRYSDVQVKKKNEYTQQTSKSNECKYVTNDLFMNRIENGWRVCSRFLSYSNYILDYKYKHSSFYLTPPNSSYIGHHVWKERLKQSYDFIQLKNVPVVFFFFFILTSYVYFINTREGEKKKKKQTPSGIDHHHHHSVGFGDITCLNNSTSFFFFSTKEVSNDN
jgi:hypothetical protein